MFIWISGIKYNKQVILLANLALSKRLHSGKYHFFKAATKMSDTNIWSRNILVLLFLFLLALCIHRYIMGFE
jgi:hypothetical protein